eukprot:UN23226
MFPREVIGERSSAHRKYNSPRTSHTKQCNGVIFCNCDQRFIPSNACQKCQLCALKANASMPRHWNLNSSFNPPIH